MGANGERDKYLGRELRVGLTHVLSTAEASAKPKFISETTE